ncbi:MAG TPA: glycosyltransferase [Terracidiphilus sp.]|nr:glycosyltransferase [Terracidiphilus sp.]
MSDQAGTGAAALDGVTVLQMVSSFGRSSFGAGYGISNLSAALWRAGVNVFLVSVDEEKDAYAACEEAGFPRDRLIRASLIIHPRFRFSPFLLSRLLKVTHEQKVILHSHGMWTYMSYLAGKLRRRLQCPQVFMPHGELEPYALGVSHRKKAIASMLFARRNLQEVSCVCALSEQEQTSIREFGYAGRVAVLPYGMNPASPCTETEVSAFRAKHEVAPGSRVMLFLSRIAPKKNLPMLLRAFAAVVKSTPEWKLLIAGGDEKGHLHEVRRLIEDLKLDDSVKLIGPVYGHDKACALTSASLFVLPSHSEGLPIAVLEAMEYAKPVLITDGWTLPVKTSARYGWKVHVDLESIEAALREAMATSEVTLNEMGQAARSIVREHFAWDSVAKQACSLYASLLDDSGKDSDRHLHGEAFQ